MNDGIKIKSRSSEKENNNRQELCQLFKNNPLPENEILMNLGLYLTRQNLTRILMMNEIYQLILQTPGCIMEFGCRWGQNLALFESLRGIYEPYNSYRKIIGFDTFDGFVNTTEKDKDNQNGDYKVTKDYYNYLYSIMEAHEKESPIGHIKKFEINKGDAVISLENYLKKHPETIIAFAYFDFDIYDPTIKCLELIKKHITKGSVIGFDQLNNSLFPGETQALKESMGLSNIKLQRNNYCSCQSYFIVE